MEKAVELGLDWAGLPTLATVARLPCHTGHMRGETPESDCQPMGSRSRGVPGVAGERGYRV